MMESYIILNGLMDIRVSEGNRGTLLDSLKGYIRQKTWLDSMAPESFASIAFFARVCYSIARHGWILGLSQEDLNLLLEVQQIRTSTIGAEIRTRIPDLRSTGASDPVFADKICKEFIEVMES